MSAETRKAPFYTPRRSGKTLVRGTGLSWGSSRAYAEAPYWQKGKVVSKTAYLAGPMRGYDQFNFPAFDAGKKVLESQGWTVLSPADHDRETGFDETLNSLDGFSLRDAFKWDIGVILNEADAIIMLPGWEKSSGVTKAELPVAQTIGLEVYEIRCLTDEEIVPLTAEEIQGRLDYTNGSPYLRGYVEGVDAEREVSYQQYTPCD